LEPQKLVLSANVTHAFDCDNANSGAINLLVAGGTPPFTYAWSNGATTEDLTAISAGNYSVSVTDARGCTKSIQNAINRQPPIVIGVDTKTDFNCETKYVKQTFVAQVSGGMPPYQLSWSSGTVSGANNEMMNTNQNGTVVLGVTDNLGCTANYSFNVKNPVLGNPDFTTNSIGFSTYGIYSIIDPIQFTNTATGDYINIAWDFGDGSVSNEVNPIHSFVNEGSYVVTQTVTYPFGCIYTHIITLTVDKGYELMSPNGFTPNGDGINETFKPVFVGLKSLQLDVYDTWGELVYSETGETLQGWDGKVKGKESENGNYYYKVKATTFYGTVVSKDGPFTLIK
jgi:gliding motility-associated-like protein